MLLSPTCCCAALVTLAAFDRDADRPTEHYYQAQRQNSAVMALAPTLMRLRSTSTILLRETDTKWDDEGHPVLRDAGCSLRNISRAVRKTPLFAPFYTKNDHFTKTGSGQT
jgi:hypothetical protein